MRKKILFLFVTILAGLLTYAQQVPQCINYQTIVRDNAGAIVKNQNVSLKFSILKNNMDGSAVYSEKFTVPTNQFGIVNVKIGNGSVLSGTFSEIDWGSGASFLKVYLDLSGGTNYTEMGTTEMVSVPYAFYAGSIYVNYSNGKLTIGDQTVEIGSGGSGSGTGDDTVTDIDGNVYSVVTIGAQKWMGENLKTTRLNNGEAMINATDQIDTIKVRSAYMWYNNSISNKDTYGALYSWKTSISRKVCPAGWHVPTESDWNTLVTYAGGENSAGAKLKETGTAHWRDPNTNATDEFGFTALAAGAFINDFNSINDRAYFWERNDTGNHYWRMLNYSNNKVTHWHTSSNTYISIRCIKD